MDRSSRESMEERVERLEQTVQDLQATVDALRAERRESDETEEDAGTTDDPIPTSRPDATTGTASPVSSFVDRIRASVAGSTEDWLNRVGIGLLLFGLAFLFKYSIDRGWLVPAVRVAFGAGLGAVLLGGGLRVAGDRRALSQVLLGGSSAAFYTTVFAAHQLYGLVAHPVAFACMTAVTVGTFVLAVRQDGAVLGVIGAIGGLGTPFVLDPGTGGSVPALVGYTVLLLGGMSAIYLYRGWRTLLYTSAVGGWLVMLAAVARVAYEAPVLDQWAVQGGLVAIWLLLGGVPVSRAILRARHPERWPGPDLPDVSWLRPFLRTPPAYALVGGSPLLAYAASRALWEEPSALWWGGIALAGTLFYGTAYHLLVRRAVHRYAPAHAVVAVVLGAVGLSEWLDGSTLLLAWGVEALAVHGAARRLDAPVLRWTGHAFALLVGLVWIDQVETVQTSVRPIVHAAGLSELVVVGLVLAASWLQSSGAARLLYRGAALAGWLAWWWPELAAVPDGDAYVSAVWGVTALGLLLASARVRSSVLPYAALGTLGLFVGKLFLVDLARLSPVWRILLFLGFGGVFLVISYALPGIWRRETEEDG